MIGRRPTSRWIVVSVCAGFLAGFGLYYAGTQSAAFRDTMAPVEVGVSPIEVISTDTIIDVPIADMPVVDEPITDDPIGDKPIGVTPPPKIPPPVVKTGKLIIESQPVTQVYINGKRVGSTPLRQPWPVGKHEIELRNDELGIRKTLELNVQARSTARHKTKFKKGFVSFLVVPWGNVYAHGKKLGTTPMAPVQLYEGTHRITLANPQTGKRKTVKVQVVAGGTKKVSVSLE